jgi:hypothetical protein
MVPPRGFRRKEPAVKHPSVKGLLLQLATAAVVLTFAVARTAASSAA